MTGAKEGFTVFEVPKFPPLDVVALRAYNRAHDEGICHHYSNYVPGALTQASCRDKAYGMSAPPLFSLTIRA